MDPFAPHGGACESHMENQLEPSLWAAPTPVVPTHAPRDSDGQEERLNQSLATGGLVSSHSFQPSIENPSYLGK